MPKRKTSEIIERLSGDEAKAVVLRLAAERHDLVPDLERMAGELLGGVTFDQVTQDVEKALRAITMDQMRDRAGQHAGGYTEPKEAALHLMEEAVQPYLDDMLRRRTLGREDEAQETCQGIVLGLYRMRGKMQSHEVLQWCPDFPSGHAWWVFNVWSEETTKGHARQRTVTRQRWLSREFVEKLIPRWDGMAKPEEERR